MYGTYLRAAAVVALLVLTSCSTNSSNTAPKTGAAKPSGAQEPVLAKTAFWEMYKSAHSWDVNIMPLALESKEIPGIKNAGGRAAMWTATFGSPTRREARVFSYAVAAHAPDIYQGITVGNPTPWGGPVPTALSFSTDEFSVDSDAAYQAASTLAAGWLSKNPGQEPSFTLGNASGFPGPVWYVLWGTKKSGYAVYVDAKTGKTFR